MTANVVAVFLSDLKLPEPKTEWLGLASLEVEFVTPEKDKP